MTESFTADDEGKTVVDSNGNEVGRVKEVQGDTAHVDPDPNIADTIMSKLGWGESDQETYALEGSNVESITDDQVRLNRM